MIRPGTYFASPIGARREPARRFRHEAWIYHGEREFIAGAAPFVRGGLDAGEAVMVATAPTNLEWLERELGADAARVELVDMAEAGRNPGRILSMWRDFVARACADGGAARGIGEPVWAGRGAEELEECRRHEALLNDAFDPDTAIWLVCPYDGDALDDAALAPVATAHPRVVGADGLEVSPAFDSELGSRALDGELPAPPAAARRIAIDPGRLGKIRGRARALAAAAGLDEQRIGDLRLVVTELATNALRHGGGGATLTLWRDDDTVVCQVDDRGSLRDPLVGRERPNPQRPAGYGLWLVHQLGDLVQIRSSGRGTSVRASIRVG